MKVSIWAEDLWKFSNTEKCEGLRGHCSNYLGQVQLNNAKKKKTQTRLFIQKRPQ